MQAQMAIKRRAEEAQAEMADMMAWQTEQKRKDAALRQAAATSDQPQAQQQPPIRGTAAAARKAPSTVQRGGPKVGSDINNVILMRCSHACPLPPARHAL